MKTFNYETPFYYDNMDNSILLTIDEHRAYHEILKNNHIVKKFSCAVYCYNVKLWRVFFNTPITKYEAFDLGKQIHMYLIKCN